MSKEKEMKQHLQQYDKDTLIELYLQKDFDTKQQLAENAQHTEQLLKENAQLKESLEQKDKEIQDLSIELSKQAQNFIDAEEREKEQRHQICEKIEDVFNKDYSVWFNGDRTSYYISKEKFDMILNKIEKGE